MLNIRWPERSSPMRQEGGADRRGSLDLHKGDVSTGVARRQQSGGQVLQGPDLRRGLPHPRYSAFRDHPARQWLEAGLGGCRTLAHSRTAQLARVAAARA